MLRFWFGNLGGFEGGGFGFDLVRIFERIFEVFGLLWLVGVVCFLGRFRGFLLGDWLLIFKY